MNTGDDEHRRRRLTGLAIGLATVALGAAAIALIPDLRNTVSLVLHGDFGALRQHIRGLGTGGVLVLLALMMAHAVLFYPSEIVTATAGFAYGFLPGLALVMGGWLASALLAFLLGRTLGRPLLNRLFGERRFSGLEQGIERGGVTLLLAARLIPVVPFSLIGYVAGAARVGVWRFAWTTALGFLPLTAAVAYLGSRASSLSLEDPILWAVALVLLALLVATRFLRFAPRTPRRGSHG